MIERTDFDSICVLTMNAPPVNALGVEMRSGLQELLQAAFADDSTEAVVLSSALSLFCGGADIQEFKSRQLSLEPQLPGLCQMIDNAPKLVVAGINGIAMGGALELCLACDYRVGRSSALLGLPEIKLGLLPGAGGTQRLPRVAGLELALDMILSGNPVSAERAHKAGLLDELVPEHIDFLQATINYTRNLISSNSPSRQTAQMTVDQSSVSADFFSEQEQQLGLKTMGQVAPLRCLKSIQAACNMDLETGLAQERQAFHDLLDTPQARGMIHLFFAERNAQKVPGVTRETVVRPIESVAVLGAGTMGTGIAIALANAEIPVVLLDMADENLSAGLGRINEYYQRAVFKGRLSEAEAETRLGCVSGTLDFSDLSEADLIIEAVFENMDIKKAIFEQLDEACKAGAVLATNTSTLDINEIAAVTTRPADVIGMHFFSPANVMKLLEIVRGSQTSPEIINSVIKFARRIQKVPVVVNVCFGFVGNRMLEPYFREASRLMLEGAAAEQIDRVLTRFGMAMGVLSMGDLAGIDVGYFVREGRREILEYDPSYQAIQDKLYSLGRYGQKTGRGVYIYKGREKINDPKVVKLCEELAKELNITRRDVSDTEILERCIYPLINEGFLLLEEGIAYRSSDCDIIWVNGYGFPAWRGGPMQYANEIGLETVLAGMRKYEQELGEYGKKWFTPATLLVELTEQL